MWRTLVTVHGPVHHKVMQWLRESLGRLPQLELLYRASRDGKSASAFHAKCDNKGPTLTVVTSDGGYEVGAYTDVAWTSRGNHTRSDRAWLFTTKCHAGLPPTQMKLTNSGYAMKDASSYGPTFGGNHDLHVPNNPQTAWCTANLGNSYRLPSGYPSTFLAEDGAGQGQPYFRCAEIEVFRV